jgi:hypothetical protein
MFELVKQDNLIEQNSTENNQLGTFQAFDRDLTAPFEHVFEQAIERFDRLMAQEMKNATDIDARIVMRIGFASISGSVSDRTIE